MEGHPEQLGPHLVVGENVVAAATREPVGDDCLAGGGAMGALMRSTDWAATPLGPVSTWPQSLRTSVSICLVTSFPMMIAWGRSLLMLYNDGYLPVLGTKKHPRALGQPLLECFSELRDLMGPMFRGVMESGEPVGAEDMMFPLERHGYAEETYFAGAAPAGRPGRAGPRPEPRANLRRAPRRSRLGSQCLDELLGRPTAP